MTRCCTGKPTQGAEVKPGAARSKRMARRLPSAASRPAAGRRRRGHRRQATSAARLSDLGHRPHSPQLAAETGTGRIVDRRVHDSPRRHHLGRRRRAGSQSDSQRGLAARDYRDAARHRAAGGIHRRSPDGPPRLPISAVMMKPVSFASTLFALIGTAVLLAQQQQQPPTTPPQSQQPTDVSTVIKGPPGRRRRSRSRPSFRCRPTTKRRPRPRRSPTCSDDTRTSASST